jgi:hypothetical protein
MWRDYQAEVRSIKRLCCARASLALKRSVEVLLFVKNELRISYFKGVPLPLVLEGDRLLVVGYFTGAAKIKLTQKL